MAGAGEDLLPSAFVCNQYFHALATWAAAFPDGKAPVPTSAGDASDVELRLSKRLSNAEVDFRELVRHCAEAQSYFVEEALRHVYGDVIAIVDSDRPGWAPTEPEIERVKVVARAFVAGVRESVPRLAAVSRSYIVEPVNAHQVIKRAYTQLRLYNSRFHEAVTTAVGKADVRGLLLPNQQLEHCMRHTHSAFGSADSP